MRRWGKAGKQSVQGQNSSIQRSHGLRVTVQFLLCPQAIYTRTVFLAMAAGYYVTSNHMNSLLSNLLQGHVLSVIERYLLGWKTASTSRNQVTAHNVHTHNSGSMDNQDTIQFLTFK